MVLTPVCASERVVCRSMQFRANVLLAEGDTAAREPRILRPVKTSKHPMASTGHTVARSAISPGATPSPLGRARIAPLWDSFRFTPGVLGVTTTTSEQMAPSVSMAWRNMRTAVTGYHDMVAARTFLAMSERDLTVLGSVSSPRLGSPPPFTSPLIYNSSGCNYAQGITSLAGFWLPAIRGKASSSFNGGGVHSSGDAMSTAPSSLASSMIEGNTPHGGTTHFKHADQLSRSACMTPLSQNNDSPVRLFERFEHGTQAQQQPHPSRQSVVNWMLTVFQAMGWPPSCFFIAIHSFDFCLARKRMPSPSGCKYMSIPLLTTGCTLAGVASECDHMQLQKARCLIGQVPSVTTLQEMLCAELEVVATMSRAGSLIRQTPLDFILMYLATMEMACPGLYQEVEQVLVKFSVAEPNGDLSENARQSLSRNHGQSKGRRPTIQQPTTVIPAGLFSEHIMGLSELKCSPPHSSPGGPIKDVQLKVCGIKEQSDVPEGGAPSAALYVTLPLAALLAECSLSLSVSYYLTGMYSVYPTSSVIAGLMVTILRGMGLEISMETVQSVFGQQITQRLPALLCILPRIIRRCLEDSQATACWPPFVRTTLIAIAEHPQRYAAARVAAAANHSSSAVSFREPSKRFPAETNRPETEGRILWQSAMAKGSAAAPRTLGTSAGLLSAAFTGCRAEPPSLSAQSSGGSSDCATHSTGKSYPNNHKRWLTRPGSLPFAMTFSTEGYRHNNQQRGRLNRVAGRLASMGTTQKQSRKIA